MIPTLQTLRAGSEHWVVVVVPQDRRLVDCARDHHFNSTRNEQDEAKNLTHLIRSHLPNLPPAASHDRPIENTED